MKKIFNFSRVSHKVTKVILILMVTVMLIFACILVPLEIQLLNQQIESNEEQIKSVSFENFEKTLTDLLDSAVFLSTVKIFSLPENHTNEDYKNYLDMKNQLSAVGYINDYISDIYISDGEESFGLSLPTQDSKKDETYDLILSRKRDIIFESENFEIFKANGANGNEYFFHYYVKNLSNNGVLMRIEKKNFSDEIFVESDNVIYQGWLDNSDEIVFASQKKSIGKTFSVVFSLRSHEETIERKNIDFDGEKGKITVTKENKYSFRLITVLRTDSYQKSHQIFYVGLLILVLVIAFIFVVTVLINNMTYKPFKELLALVGDPSADMILDKNNAEYNYIVTNIKKIISENETLNLQADELLEKFKEQQFIACQMQISPHFLFNTLSSISGLSVMTLSELDNPITNAINNLANMLSEVLLSSSRVITVEKEIELTKTYIQILLLRYKDKFAVDWDVDETLLDEYIIKLSLQPLIENAVQHAFDWNEKESRIIISIKKENGLIVVSVKDNGVGLSEEKLAEIRHAMNDFSNIDKKIGLRNTNRRIKLLYGEQYEISVCSKKGEGTSFEFSYPIK